MIVDEEMFVDSKSDGGQTPAGCYVPEAYTAPNLEELKEEDDLPF